MESDPAQAGLGKLYSGRSQSGAESMSKPLSLGGTLAAVPNRGAAHLPEDPRTPWIECTTLPENINAEPFKALHHPRSFQGPEAGVYD